MTKEALLVIQKIMTLQEKLSAAERIRQKLTTECFGIATGILTQHGKDVFGPVAEVPKNETDPIKTKQVKVLRRTPNVSIGVGWQDYNIYLQQDQRE